MFGANLTGGPSFQRQVNSLYFPLGAFLQNLSVQPLVHSLESHCWISLHLSVILFSSLFCTFAWESLCLFLSQLPPEQLFLFLLVLLGLCKPGACPCLSGNTFPLQPPLVVSSGPFLQACSSVPYHFSVCLCFCFLCIFIFLILPPPFTAKLCLSARALVSFLIMHDPKVVLHLTVHVFVAVLPFLLSG